LATNSLAVHRRIALVEGDREYPVILAQRKPRHLCQHLGQLGVHCRAASITPVVRQQQDHRLAQHFGDPKIPSFLIRQHGIADHPIAEKSRLVDLHHRSVGDAVLRRRGDRTGHRHKQRSGGYQ
jgi:hypothetical protein